jgi:hypothetical protein
LTDAGAGDRITTIEYISKAMTKTAEPIGAQRAGQLLKGRTQVAHKPIPSEPEARKAFEGEGTE